MYKSHPATIRGLFKLQDDKVSARGDIIKTLIDLIVSGSKSEYAQAKQDGLRGGEAFNNSMNYSELTERVTFNVIAGSFQNKDNAENYVNELNESGYEGVNVLDKSGTGFFRVSLVEFKYKDFGDALEYRNSVNKKEEMNTWLLTKVKNENTISKKDNDTN
jgi:hypothetical protein